MVFGFGDTPTTFTCKRNLAGAGLANVL